MPKRLHWLLAALWLSLSAPVHAQVGAGAEPAPPAQVDAERRIGVEGVAPDSAIEKRISNILRTSGWFESVQVSVSQGIVILDGRTQREAYLEWAETIASRTEDVVAVINKMKVVQKADWSFAPIVDQAKALANKTLANLPLIVVSLVILLLTLFVAKRFGLVMDRFLGGRVQSGILRRLLAKIATVPIALIGIYFVLKITGLSNLAVTVLGGTGILGLVIGIAFRDIAENFLASVLISIQRPFQLGDLIVVEEYRGFVEAVTTRGTVLVTEQGNHVQIPNAIIYKAAITNFTANPNMRMDFTVGIGYDASIAKAQQIALDVLSNHPAVLRDPEPWVLAEELASATVNLRIYFWVNNTTHNVLKVKSSAIRMVKHAFVQNDISMPDDAREVIFPQGIPLYNIEQSDKMAATGRPAATSAEDDMVSTRAEASLTSDADVVKNQGKNRPMGENEENLLKAH